MEKANSHQISVQVEEQEKLEIPLTPEEREKLVNSLQTPQGGWTKKDLEKIGVGWPPLKGWKAAFIKYGKNWETKL